MTISRLAIQAVRNLSSVSFDPSPGFNFIYGKNGAGKSSVLEAIHMLGSGRSFRTHRHKQLIQYEQADFTIFAELERRNHHYRVGMKRTRSSEPEIRINGESTQRLAELVGLLPIQILTPDSPVLLTSGSKVRRQFLDWGLFYRQELFYPAWRRYARSLKQRNALVRQQLPYRQVGPWEHDFVENGRLITQMRTEFVAQLQAALLTFTDQFLPGSDVELSYQSGWLASAAGNDDYQAQLQDHYDRDIKVGHTQLGPHRGGFKLKVDGVAAEETCSRGQLKLLVAALLLAQGSLLSDSQGTSCIYLIDDFAAELDEARRALLIECLIAIKSQVFITATDELFVKQVRPQLEAAKRPFKLFHVERGQLVTS
ncbi:DNA replication/repair protein RecF [Neiella marina]|uniref:DNA replication and repair protein RecF n=1 Tax=Neiella holothuriorum TaxID=2870530 RepID=A0ABS7EK85_9GAMM|nr:DNA replication/repair protein RecF [Neiella holothuriorum]MBW8192759.1 DNA replication/repair protein RecF [Neiella holothuriorum]